jgi:hypothetical protein
MVGCWLERRREFGASHRGRCLLLYQFTQMDYAVVGPVNVVRCTNVAHVLASDDYRSAFLEFSGCGLA